MADLNKVIESLEFCAAGAECDHCKYAQENKCDYEGCHHLMADAAELLKSQQAEITKLNSKADRLTADNIRLKRENKAIQKSVDEMSFQLYG